MNAIAHNPYRILGMFANDPLRKQTLQGYVRLTRWGKHVLLIATFQTFLEQ